MVNGSSQRRAAGLESPSMMVRLLTAHGAKRLIICKIGGVSLLQGFSLPQGWLSPEGIFVQFVDGRNITLELAASYGVTHNQANFLVKNGWVFFGKTVKGEYAIFWKRHIITKAQMRFMEPYLKEDFIRKLQHMDSMALSMWRDEADFIHV